MSPYAYFISFLRLPFIFIPDGAVSFSSAGIWSAAMDGDLERVEALAQKGIDPNLRDASGYTALVSFLGMCFI